jgi:hypothetical protein
VTTTGTQLDAWVAQLGTDVGLWATRDPDQVLPPCLYVTTPEITTVTAGGQIVLDLPVYLVAEFTGKQALDYILDALPRVLEACGQGVAALAPLTVADTPYTAYLLTVPVRIDPVTAVGPGAPGVPVAVDWKRIEPGWYSCNITWVPPTIEGSSPITHYRYNWDGNEDSTDGPVNIVHLPRIAAGTTAEAFVYAVNSETYGPPSETGYLQAPPT